MPGEEETEESMGIYINRKCLFTFATFFPIFHPQGILNSKGMRLQLKSDLNWNRNDEPNSMYKEGEGICSSLEDPLLTSSSIVFPLHSRSQFFSSSFSSEISFKTKYI